MAQEKLNFEKLKEILIDRKAIANLFKLNEKYINELVAEQGLPKLDYNTYNLVDCIWWYLDYKDFLCEKKIEKIKTTKPQDELALKSARLKELEILEREGKLVNIDEVREAWISEYKKFEELLNGLVPRLTTKVANKSVEEIKMIVNQEVEQLKNSIINLPLPVEED